MAESFRTLSRRIRTNAAKADLYLRTLWFACCDPRTPWYAKALAAAVVAYGLSPIDLIPDFIPVLGHLDDVILIPLGIALAIRIIPLEILAESRQKAQQQRAVDQPRGNIGILIAVLLGLGVTGALAMVIVMLI